AMPFPCSLPRIKPALPTLGNTAHPTELLEKFVKVKSALCRFLMAVSASAQRSPPAVTLRTGLCAAMKKAISNRSRNWCCTSVLLRTEGPAPGSHREVVQILIEQIDHDGAAISFELDREHGPPPRSARDRAARDLRGLTLAILPGRKGINQLKGIICPIRFVQDPAILILDRETSRELVYSCIHCQIHWL